MLRREASLWSHNRKTHNNAGLTRIIYSNLLHKVHTCCFRLKIDTYFSTGDLSDFHTDELCAHYKNLHQNQYFSMNFKLAEGLLDCQQH